MLWRFQECSGYEVRALSSLQKRSVEVAVPYYVIFVPDPPCAGRKEEYLLRDGPFDIRGGGGWIFFEKTIVCFPIGQKNVFNEVKNKKFVLHSVNF